jgi:hypothetical protein
MVSAFLTRPLLMLRGFLYLPSLGLMSLGGGLVVLT